MLIFQWIMNFFLLNLYILLGIIAGCILFGFFPAINAGIVVSRQLMENGDISISKSFYKEYREKFIISQKLGLSLLFLNLIVFSNWVFWSNSHGIEWSGFLCTLFLIILFFLFSGSMLIFPVAVHANLSLKDVCRLLLFSLSQLHLYFLQAIGLIIIYFALLIMPGIFLFLGGSLAIAWMMFVHRLFVGKIVKVQKKLQSQTKTSFHPKWTSV